MVKQNESGEFDTKLKIEPKIKTEKFVKQTIEENVTRENIEDIIKGQENAIIESEKEISRRNSCIEHYKQYLL